MTEIKNGPLVPIVENSTAKSPHWRQRDSFLMRGMNPPSAWIHDGKLRQAKTSYNWEEVVAGENGLPYVRCKTFEYQDTDPAEEDGAEVAILAGKNTPVQYVASETNFAEIPLRGKLIFLSVSPEGKMGKAFFDVSESKDSTHMAMVSRGWIMSWYALADNKWDALVLETERPGFSQSSLPTVDNNAEFFGATKIPKEFWDTIDLLKNGKEDEVLPGCVTIV